MNSQKRNGQTLLGTQPANRYSNRHIDLVIAAARFASTGEAVASIFAVFAIQAVQIGLGGML